MNVKCKPTTFTVRNGTILRVGDPHGFLRTDRSHESVVLELEWKHEGRTDIAGILDISPRTVGNDWLYGKAFLRKALRQVP